MFICWFETSVTVFTGCWRGRWSCECLIACHCLNSSFKWVECFDICFVVHVLLCRVLMGRMDYLESLEKLGLLYVAMFYDAPYKIRLGKRPLLYNRYLKICHWFCCKGKSGAERSYWHKGTAWAQSTFYDFIFMFFIVWCSGFIMWLKCAFYLDRVLLESGMERNW